MNTDLTRYTTFRTAAKARQIIILRSHTQLHTLSKALENQSTIILGNGSNVLFVEDVDSVVIVNRLRGITVKNTTDANVEIFVAAGENWHDTVLDLSSRGFYGLENLALIPGTVGAAPVQNIGAYGLEVKDFIKTVEAYDLKRHEYKIITASDCGFSYRNSNFKSNGWKHRFIITGVTFRLKKQFTPLLTYPGLSYPTRPETASNLIARIISIRQSKLPDPKYLPNAGSFFKNPIISLEKLAELQKVHADIPFYEITDGIVKIPAAWLVEHLGLKGMQRGNGAGIYKHHALILVNYHTAHGSHIHQLASDIMEQVHIVFRIHLLPEKISAAVIGDQKCYLGDYLCVKLLQGNEKPGRLVPGAGGRGSGSSVVRRPPAQPAEMRYGRPAEFVVCEL